MGESVFSKGGIYSCILRWGNPYFQMGESKVGYFQMGGTEGEWGGRVSQIKCQGFTRI